MTDLSPAEALFFAALEKRTPEERDAYLAAECGDDRDLRRRVERLLAAHPQVGSFLEPLDPAPDPNATTYQPQREAPGAVIAGRFKLLEEIGEGGMGTVWIAEQMQPVRRKVALKLIKAGMDSKAVLSRFEAERQALALMDHPNIAKVLDGGLTDGGRPFFVMEYVKAVPFTKYCDDARLSIAERLKLFVPVCHAVQHAHQKGIIHRDLKPSNILICLYDGKPVPKVIDFGLAKAMHQRLTEHTLHTAHGVMLGTPLYMSPEQAEFNNLDVDTRTDIYALGVILYELLTGTTPLEKQRFKDAACHEMLRLIKEEEPPRPSARLSSSGSLPSLAAQRQLEPLKLTQLVRGELDWIVMKCLEKDRSRRYETATGLARDMERYLADEVVEARSPSAIYRLRKFVRRNKGRMIAVAAFAAMLFLVGGMALYGLWWADRQSAERRHEQALMAARSNDALKATLDQVEAALKAARLAEAGTLLGQAGKKIDEQTPADLRERHERLEKDERTVREINDIFEERWRVSRSDTRLDNERAKLRYPALFLGYGLAVGKEPAAQIVEKIRKSVIAEALSSAMAEWFFVDPKYPDLLLVADMLDPEQWRAALRGAIAKDETDRIKELAKKIEGSQLSPPFAIGLGLRLDEEGMQILKAAWRSHPDSFALALTLGSLTSNGEDQGWCRTALALRPENALTHYYYAVALSRQDRPTAIAELHQAIRLAPRFAKAHGLLAFLLTGFLNGSALGDGSEALAAARKAIELDDQNLAGLLVLFAQLLKKQEYVEAAAVFWRLRDAMKLAEEFDKTGYDYNPSSDSPVLAASMGYLMAVFPRLPIGLIRSGRPFEAYRLCALDNDSYWFVVEREHTGARAAALAGTGQGLDAPPPAERATIRKRSLEWLNTEFTTWTTADPTENGEAAYKAMTDWLSDPDLAGVRDDQWLAELPVEEREQWQKLWAGVRSLRDRTAPAKSCSARWAIASESCQ